MGVGCTSISGSDIRLSIYEDLPGIKPEWRAFQQYADCTVFQSFEWLDAWQRHIGARSGVMPAVIAGRDVAGALLFIIPLAVERGGFARKLTWLGSELCDYNAPLLAPNFSKQLGPVRFLQVWSDITERLRNHRHLRYDLLSLDKMPDKVGDQANPFLLLGVGVHPSGAYRTYLGGDWETFYAEKRSSATRRRDRTKRKKLSEFGEVRFTNPDAADVGP